MADHDYCTRCWPKRNRATCRGAFGYEALCNSCYATLDPDTEVDS